MAPDGAWLQWVEEECILIKPWVYCILGITWPLLRLVYRKPLDGQHAEYKLFKRFLIHSTILSSPFFPTSSCPATIKTKSCCTIFSYPDWKFDRLHTEVPGQYESYVDLVAGA